MDEPTPKEPSPIRFDDDTPGMYDVVLIVEEEKFFCSKSVLAKHSEYFHRMFFGNFPEKDMKEVTLNDPLDADEFRTLLELIYTVNRLDDENIEGVLALSHIWCAKVAIQECLDFLIHDSKKKLWEKFELAEKFDLQDNLISKAETTMDMIKMVSQKDLRELAEKTKQQIRKRDREIFRPSATLSSDRLNTIQFNDANEGMYDVVFVVMGESFYCTKSSLAKHSTHFHSMFFGKNPNTEKEIVLEEPSSKSVFQAFLETINAVKCLNDENAGGVLRLAHFWNVPIAKEKCMEFLLGEESQMPFKERFELGIDIDSMELKKRAISECKTFADLKSIAGDVDSLDEATTKLLLKKSFEVPSDCQSCSQNRQWQRNIPPDFIPFRPYRPQDEFINIFRAGGPPGMMQRDRLPIDLRFYQNYGREA